MSGARLKQYLDCVLSWQPVHARVSCRLTGGRSHVMLAFGPMQQQKRHATIDCRNVALTSIIFTQVNRWMFAWTDAEISIGVASAHAFCWFWCDRAIPCKFYWRTMHRTYAHPPTHVCCCRCYGLYIMLRVSGRSIRRIRSPKRSPKVHRLHSLI